MDRRGAFTISHLPPFPKTFEFILKLLVLLLLFVVVVLEQFTPKARKQFKPDTLCAQSSCNCERGKKMVDLLLSYNLIDWKQLRADRINLNSL